MLRSAKISSYAPGFKTPLILSPKFLVSVSLLYLIVKLGSFPLILVCAATLLTLIWYHFIGKKKATQTAGAIHHIYERLGRAADTSVDREISVAMQSHGLRSEDDYAGLIARASVLYVPNDGDIDLAATRASQVLGHRIGIDADTVNEQFCKTGFA